MYRTKLKPNECMLFIFGALGMHAIWMKNMLFSIDAVWLDSKYTVVGIERNLKPCKSLFGCKEYYPKENAKYLIELGSGEAAKIRMGDKIPL